jgi:hypothetical protein
MWCQFGTCIASYTHRGALGERDLRARALAVGWRYDALGRLACPDCAQHDPAFWPTRAPAPSAGTGAGTADPSAASALAQPRQQPRAGELERALLAGPGQPPTIRSEESLFIPNGPVVTPRPRADGGV